MDDCKCLSTDSVVVNSSVSYTSYIAEALRTTANANKNDYCPYCHRIYSIGDVECRGCGAHRTNIDTSSRSFWGW